jgi:hypothetical protein
MTQRCAGGRNDASDVKFLSGGRRRRRRGAWAGGTYRARAGDRPVASRLGPRETGTRHDHEWNQNDRQARVVVRHRVVVQETAGCLNASSMCVERAVDKSMPLADVRTVESFPTGRRDGRVLYQAPN